MDCKKLIQQLFFVALLIMLSFSNLIAQIPIKDTVISKNNLLGNVIKYSANDTIHTNIKTREVYLSGNAKVQVDDVIITAGYVWIDLEKNEIKASYRFDKDSNKIELPSFTNGNEAVVSETIRYNMKTKKGFLKELTIKQDEFFFK